MGKKVELTGTGRGSSKARQVIAIAERIEEARRDARRQVIGWTLIALVVVSVGLKVAEIFARMVVS